MQVEQQNYYVYESSSTMHHCRYPNNNKTYENEAMSLPSLQTFQYERNEMDPRYQNQQQYTTTTYEQNHYQTNGYYDPYPHASYSQQQYERKHLDPAFIEETLNECMPFIEPMMNLSHTPPQIDTLKHGRYDIYDNTMIQQHSIHSNDSSYSPSSDTQRKNEKGSQRLCRIAGCNKGIRSRGLCKGHGGGRRCQTAGCKISDQGGGHCIAHGGGRRCSVKDCTRSAQARGLCKCHGGGRPCKYQGCTKNSQRSGYCMAHGKIMNAATVKTESIPL